MNTTQKLEAARKQREIDQDRIDELRTKRAQLFVRNSTKHAAEIAKLDEAIEKLRITISNAPAVVAVLENQLAEEKAVAAQAERDQLLAQQQKVVKDIEQLSQDFIKALQAAKIINEQLRTALIAEAALKEKTGQQFLESYCDGSQDSLRMLLEKSEAELAGQHTAVVGAGMVGSNVPIRL